MLKPARPDADVSYPYHERPAGQVGPGVLPELTGVTLQVAAETFDGQTVAAGQVGTIVAVHGDGEAYDVEFTSPTGVAAVGAEEIAPVEG